MKEKVAKAIKDRAKAKVNDAANEMRKAVNRFHEQFGIHHSQTLENRETVVANLRSLADSIEGKGAWIIPKSVWKNAEIKAYDEFMNQFDALTRFVNQNISCPDGDCIRPEE